MSLSTEVYRMELLMVKEAEAEVSSAVKNCLDLWVDAQEKDCSPEMALSLARHQRKSFDVAMTAFKKNLSAARVECADIQCNRDEVLPKFKALDTDLWEYLNAVS